MKDFSAHLGKGIYSAADAARIFRMPYDKAKYWFTHYARQKFVQESNYIYHFHLKNIVAVNFLTLMEMKVFYTLKEAGVTTRKIIKAHHVMSLALKTPYPFVRKDLYMDEGRRLFFFTNEKMLLSADEKFQGKIEGVLLQFIEKLAYGDSWIPNKFYPLGKERSVVIKPENQFGQPIIEGTNILTKTIYSLSLGGESEESISKLYDINIDQVRDAIEFSEAA